jgi:2-oxoglutarate ferredoxin oxidoreductase subunit beta
MIAMIERAMDHDGFSVIECLSECVEFYPASSTRATRAKAASSRSSTRRNGITPRGRTAPRHHRRNRRLQTGEPAVPGLFGVFFESDRPTKNVLEQKWIDTSRAKVGTRATSNFCRRRFDRMK